MYMPPGSRNTSDNTKKISILSFFGYDKREKTEKGRMHEMQNMSSDRMPCLAVRKPRTIAAEQSGITALAPAEYESGVLTSFTGVADGYFCYKGEKITNLSLTDGEKSIVDFSGNICIFPDKVYYRYLPDTDTGEIQNILRPMGKSVTAENAKLYSKYDKISGEYTAYIKCSGASFDESFVSGDSVVISGCENEQNNTYVAKSRKDFPSDDRIVSAVVDSADENYLYLVMYTKSGSYGLFENTTETEIKIEIYIPDMDHVCVHGNRLFGTAENGEYIYASRLGDCFNFNSFRGLKDDSWYAETATPGEFTGIVSYRSAVVAFKRNFLHHVYGDSPQNFSMPKQLLTGAADGKSIVEIGGVLYFMAADGFYEYSGGEPERIGRATDEVFSSCKSGTDGNRYFSCVTHKDGSHSVLVYTPEYDVWHREDNMKFNDFIRHDEYLYGAADDGLYRLCDDDGDEEIHWCAVSKEFTLDDFSFKGVNRLYLRIRSDEGFSASVYFSYDGGDFIRCGEISGSGLVSCLVPVRFKKCESFRIMIEGDGRAVIHDIEINTYTGGRTNEQKIR